MKRILGLAMTLALICGVTATSFAAGAGPKTKNKVAAAKNAVLLKNNAGKQTNRKKHRKHHATKKAASKKAATK